MLLGVSEIAIPAPIPESTDEDFMLDFVQTRVGN
jgi:hypothetical protein